MRQTMVLSKFVVGIFSVAVLTFSVAAKADAGSQDGPDAQIWLQKIHQAAQTLNYSGTFVFQQANQIRTSRITHLFDDKTEREKFEILDGKPREYIRNGDEIVSYLPEVKMLLVEKRATQGVFPAIVPAMPAVLSDYYLIRKAEVGRVAGFDSQALVLQPRDNLRYGYKLWAERSTGLLLRAQTLNERNEVVEQTAFTQVAIGEIDPAKIAPSYADTRNWRTEHAAADTLAVTDWRVKAVPAGFKKIREMKRIISDAPSSAGNASEAAITPSPREVTQIVYSDGLAAISIFIEPAAKGRTEGAIQQGALNLRAKRQGDFWLTIVGEVPALTIKQVAGSIEFLSK